MLKYIDMVENISYEVMLKKDEVEILLREVKLQYGYDFVNYSRASLIRRLVRIMENCKIPSFAELRYKALNEPVFFEYFVQEVTVNVTEMFRNPSFFKALREKVVPMLSTYPLIRIWHAGCASGEEVYSMAIILEEEGLLQKSILYATDLNQEVLKQARQGIYNIDQMKLYSENYIKSGNNREFLNYYRIRHGKAVFSEALKERMVFSVHNLVGDQSFNEFHLIICRNVLIYFNRDLQERVLNLFSESLSSFGFLAFGAKESIDYSGVRNNYTVVNKHEKIYKREN